MLDYSLTQEERKELRRGHRETRDKREADRIKAVVSLANGWTAAQVAEVLLIDANRVRNHFKRYREGGLPRLLEVEYRGSEAALNAGQLAILDERVRSHLYVTAKAVAAWVEERFGVSYTESGMTALLHRLDFVYKKPKLVPGKADPAAQEAFLVEYEKLKQHKAETDVICFMDAVHPQHNPVLGAGWIQRGQEAQVLSNTGRRRVNINGAIDLERLEPVVRFDDTIDAASTIALFEQLLLVYATASTSSATTPVTIMLGSCRTSWPPTPGSNSSRCRPMRRT